MNPFKFGTIVEGDFFTDRVEETAMLLQKLDSENHIVLISPRRFGKSSLVQKVLSQVDRPQIRIDLQYVMSVDDLAAQLLKAIFKIYPMEKVRHAMTHFRIAPTLSMNAVTGGELPAYGQRKCAVGGCYGCAGEGDHGGESFHRGA